MGFIRHYFWRQEWQAGLVKIFVGAGGISQSFFLENEELVRIYEEGAGWISQC